MTRISRLLLTVVVLVLGVLGCTSSKTPCSVSGKISYNGQPVTGGTIAFHRTIEGQSGSFGSPINADGTYEGTSMPAEEYIVTIETESMNAERLAKNYGGGKDNAQKLYREQMEKMGKAPVENKQGTYIKIPAKYNDKAKSGLTAKLTRGKNTQNFDLTD
jgi:hypothetical protein